MLVTPKQSAAPSLCDQHRLGLAYFLSSANCKCSTWHHLAKLLNYYLCTCGATHLLKRQLLVISYLACGVISDNIGNLSSWVGGGGHFWSPFLRDHSLKLAAWNSASTSLNILLQTLQVANRCPYRLHCFLSVHHNLHCVALCSTWMDLSTCDSAWYY